MALEASNRVSRTSLFKDKEVRVYKVHNDYASSNRGLTATGPYQPLLTKFKGGRRWWGPTCASATATKRFGCKRPRSVVSLLACAARSWCGNALACQNLTTHKSHDAAERRSCRSTCSRPCTSELGVSATGKRTLRAFIGCCALNNEVLPCWKRTKETTL